MVAVAVAVVVGAVAAVVKAIAATSLSVFKWFETDRLIAKREDVATSTDARITLTKSVLAIL